MISYLRLLFGATSFMLFKWFSHFSESGPDGILASNFIGGKVGLIKIAEQYGEGNGAVANKNDCGNYPGNRIGETPRARVSQPEGLKQTCDSVTEMHRKQQHRHNVETGNPKVAETGNHHRINIGTTSLIDQIPVFRIRYLHRKMQQMINHEKENDDTAPAHGPRGVSRLNRPITQIIPRTGTHIFER